MDHTYNMACKGRESQRAQLTGHESLIMLHPDAVQSPAAFLKPMPAES
jgi:hypothetical protein